MVPKRVVICLQRGVGYSGRARPLDASRPDVLIGLRNIKASILMAQRDSTAARATLRQILADYSARPGLNPALLTRVRQRLDSLGT